MPLYAMGTILSKVELHVPDHQRTAASGPDVPSMLFYISGNITFVLAFQIVMTQKNLLRHNVAKRPLSRNLSVPLSSESSHSQQPIDHKEIQLGGHG